MLKAILDDLNRKKVLLRTSRFWEWISNDNRSCEQNVVKLAKDGVYPKTLQMVDNPVVIR